MLAGLPTTSTLHVAIRRLVERLALRGEDLRIGGQQVLALHARAARPGADQQRDVGVLESAASDRCAPSMPASSGNAQSSSSIITPLSAFCAFSSGISSSCRMTG